MGDDADSYAGARRPERSPPSSTPSLEDIYPGGPRPGPGTSPPDGFRPPASGPADCPECGAALAAGRGAAPAWCPSCREARDPGR